MARVTLGSGETITIGGNTDVFGTTGEQTINVLDGSTVNFRGGFNSGETDTIRLNGNASDFVISAVGLTVTLFSAVDNIRIVLPIGANGANIVFDNGDTRTITREGASGTKIDDQLITATPVALSEGPGVYEVSSSGEVLEGGILTFTVTRTDGSTAETLQATALGFTNGGTIVAAQQGDDFTVAGATLTFGVGVLSRTFTIAAPLDALVEGVEGIQVNVVKGGTEVVATTTALILDGTPEGQTFQLTSGLDTVGTGVPTDLVGSGGNTGTGGNDTIVAVTGEVNLLNPNLGLTGALTPFDNINGGAGDDTLLVLDNGNPFTSAPNFTGVTVDNVEILDYRAPTRGFLGGAFNVNTAGFDGLESASFFINGGGTQTITLDDETTSTAANGITPTDVNTSATVTQIGNGDLIINGGGDSLVVTAAEGDVTVGGSTASNSYDTVLITGGEDIFVTDRGVAELASVAIVGAGDDISIRGAAVTAINISNLVNDEETFRDIDVDVNAAAKITLSGINGAEDDGNQLFDINSQGIITVETDGTVFGLADLISKSTRVNLISNGDLALSDINVLGTNATVSIVANGDVELDNIDGGAENGVPEVFDNFAGSSANDVRNVILSGTGSVTMTSVQQASNTADTKTTITSTDVDGGITIFEQLGDDTKFNGAANTGDDEISFGETTEDNTFGAGDDTVNFNADTFGTTPVTNTSGSFDGGAGYDVLVMESNNADTFTSEEQEVSNFEELELSFQNLGKADVIDLHNIGLDTVSNVTSNVGDGSVPEITTLNFAGSPAATGADTVTITGAGLNVVVTLVDGDSAATIASKVAAAINADPAYAASVPMGGTLVTVTGPNGVNANLSVAFGDSTSIGTPTFEQGTGAPFVFNEGVVPDAGAPTVWRLNLDDVSVLNGETVTLTVFGSVSYTNNTGGPITQNGGALAQQLAAAFAASPDVIATVDGNDLIVTTVANAAINQPFVVSGSGLATPSDIFSVVTTVGRSPVIGETEDVYFQLDGLTSGNDSILFDDDNNPLTAPIEITFSASGLTPAQMAAEFIADYNANPNRVFDASAPEVGEPFFGFDGGIELNSRTQTNVANVSAANFTFVDDNNVGVPSVVVTEEQNGELASVTLNNFISGSRLTLTNNNGDHTVNMKTDNNANVLNLVLAVDGADHGVVTADDAETVNINTSAADEGGSDTLDLLGGDLTTLVITGENGLDLNTDSTIIASVDATGLTGFFDWAADANSVNITVRTGSGGSDVDFSGVLLGGGQAAGSSGRITFIGGSGDDRIVTGGDNTARGTITTGAGDDIVVVGTVDGGNDFWSIIDFDADFDTLDFEFGEAGIVVELDQELEDLTAVFQDYLDQAARGAGDGTIRYFYWKGDTYVVQDNADGEDFVDGEDAVIRIEGEVELTADNFV